LRYVVTSVLTLVVRQCVSRNTEHPVLWGPGCRRRPADWGCHGFLHRLPEGRRVKHIILRHEWWGRRRILCHK